MPAWANGWQYFRARIESGFVRFFWSPDHRTWRGQAKDGTNFELGVPLDGTGYEGALEKNPDAPAQIFIGSSRVNTMRRRLPTPALPVNVVVYRYSTDQNVVYLTDIYDTTPGGQPDNDQPRPIRSSHCDPLRNEARCRAVVSGWLPRQDVAAREPRRRDEQRAWRHRCAARARNALSLRLRFGVARLALDVAADRRAVRVAGLGERYGRSARHFVPAIAAADVRLRARRGGG